MYRFALTVKLINMYRFAFNSQTHVHVSLCSQQMKLNKSELSGLPTATMSIQLECFIVQRLQLNQ